MAQKHMYTVEIGNTKVVLWQIKKDTFQIETVENGKSKVFNFNAGYNEAMCELIHQSRKINNATA